MGWEDVGRAYELYSGKLENSLKVVMNAQTRSEVMKGPMLRAMTYNVNAARALPDALNPLLGLLEAQSPDVVGLQEVDNDARRSGRVDQAGWLAQHLGLHSIHGRALDFDDGGQYGNALLSRYAVLDRKVVQLSAPARETYIPPPDMPDWLRPYLYEPRSILGVLLNVEGRQLRAFVTHLGLTPEQRVVQARETLQFLDAWYAREPALLLVDANAIPKTEEVEVLSQRLTDVCGDLPLDRRGTRPTPTGARCIDYIFTTPGFIVQSARVVADSGGASDHLPLVANLRLPGQVSQTGSGTGPA